MVSRGALKIIEIEQLKLHVVDLGLHNLGTVVSSLRRLGASTVLVRNPDDLSVKPDMILLPGVGNFSSAAELGESRGLWEAIRYRHERGTPILGICLGAQLLFESSEEGERSKGLGLLRGTVKRIPVSPGIAVPHVGWNTLDWVDGPVLGQDISLAASFYFTHSYYFDAQESAVLSRTLHGISFPSIAAVEGALALQFHPEKSGPVGQKILRNAVKWLAQI